jgi:hypothetical protein
MKNEITNLKIDKIPIDLCIKSFEEYLKNNHTEDMVKHSFNFELENLNVRGIVWKIYLDVLNYDDNKIDLYDWIKSTYILRTDYLKHKNKYCNRRRFTSDPLDNQNVLVIFI